MATRFYLRSTTSNVGSHARTELSSTLPVGTFDDSGNAAQDLSRTKGSSETNRANTTLAQTGQQSYFFGKHISEDLGAAGITGIAADTWNVRFRYAESSGLANFFFRVSIYVVTSSDTVRGFVYDGTADLGVEADGTGQELTVSGSAVSGIVSGDRLVCEVWGVASQAMATGYTVNVYYDGTTDVVDATSSDAASYIETPENLFPPIIQSASMADADRNWSTPYQDIAITFSDAVDITPTPNVGDTVAGLTAQVNGGANSALTYVSGNGTTSWKVRRAELIQQNDTVVLDYARSSGEILRVSDNAELAETTDASVTNNLTKRVRVLVKDKNNANLVSTSVVWAVYNGVDGNNAQDSGTNSTDSNAILDVQYTGSTAVGGTVYARIYYSAGTQSQFWDVVVW